MKSSFSSTRNKKRVTEFSKEGNCSYKSFLPSSRCTQDSKMVDRISSLPDELLSYILSFLPTKLAFTTTLLSKRWIPLCYSLPVLAFDYEVDKKYETKQDYETFDCFCRFVDTLMLSRPSTNQPLKSFHLNFFYGHPDTAFNVTKWLKAAKQHCVEEVHLSLGSHTLNPFIFISRTLVVLKLKRIDFSIDTSCVHLPLLKTLHLKHVGFRNRNDYINFLSSSAILHKLHAEHIYLRSEMHSDKNNIPEEGFKSLTLSKLVRASISSMDALFNGIDNVEFLRITKGFEDQEASFIAIPLFRNLNHIEIVFCHRSFHCWDGIGELLRHCPKLQILIIKKVC